MIWSEAALVHEALVAPRRAIVPMPDSQIDDRPGWFRILTPSLRQGGLNEIAGAALRDDEADRVIDETLGLYAQHGVRFRWTVAPGDLPADLATRLAQRGLHQTRSRAMWRPTTIEPRASETTVEEVDDRGMSELAEVIAAGWSIDPGPLLAYQRRCFAHPEGRNRFFLARRRGEPAGGAGYVALERSAYLVGGVVLAAHRGTGVYRALVEARLGHAAARGLSAATSVAMESTSAPILERLGFTTLCPVVSFSNQL